MSEIEWTHCKRYLCECEECGEFHRKRMEKDEREYRKAFPKAPGIPFRSLPPLVQAGILRSMPGVVLHESYAFPIVQRDNFSGNYCVIQLAQKTGFPPCYVGIEDDGYVHT